VLAIAAETKAISGSFAILEAYCLDQGRASFFSLRAEIG